MNCAAVTPIASQKVLCLLRMVCDYLVVVLKQLCISIKFDSHCVKLQCKWLNFSKQLPVTAVWEEHRLLSFSFYSDLGNISLIVKIQATPLKCCTDKKCAGRSQNLNEGITKC